jgi:hypothetical protein
MRGKLPMNIHNIITDSRGKSVFNMDWNTEKLGKRGATPTIIPEIDVLTVSK